MDGLLETHFNRNKKNHNLWSRKGLALARRPEFWPWFLNWVALNKSPASEPHYLYLHTEGIGVTWSSFPVLRLFLWCVKYVTIWGIVFFPDLAFPLTSLQWVAERNCQYPNNLFSVHINLKMSFNKQQVRCLWITINVLQNLISSFPYLSFFLSLPPSHSSFAFKGWTQRLWLGLSAAAQDLTKGNPPCAGTLQLQKWAVYESWSTAGVSQEATCESSQLSPVQTIQREGLSWSPAPSCPKPGGAAPAEENCNVGIWGLRRSHFLFCTGKLPFS